MDKFRAYRIDEQDGNIVAGFQELAIDDPRASGEVEVMLVYKLSPYYRLASGEPIEMSEVVDPLMDSSEVHTVVVPE